MQSYNCKLLLYTSIYLNLICTNLQYSQGNMTFLLIYIAVKLNSSWYYKLAFLDFKLFMAKIDVTHLTYNNNAQKNSKTPLYYIKWYTSIGAFKHQRISVLLSGAVIALLCSNMILHLVMFSNKGHNKQRLLKGFMVNDYCIMWTISHSKWQLN